MVLGPGCHLDDAVDVRRAQPCPLHSYRSAALREASHAHL